MIEIQQSQSSWVPVIFQSTSGTAVTNVLAQAVQVSIFKADQTGMDYSGTVGAFVQLTGAAYQLQGYYNLLLTSSHTDVTGILQYCAYTPGAQPYFGVIKIAAGDTTAIYNRLGAPAYGTIKDDIANVGVTAGSGGFTSDDRAMLSATYHTASLLPSDPASNSYLSGVVVANAFTSSDRVVINAIKLKTDYLPTDPASNATLSGVINACQTNVNNNTNTAYNNIVGSGYTTGDTLRQISLRVTSVSSGLAPLATSASVSSTVAQARDYIVGAGFVTGTDDLHGLSLQIQGITPGSGGGGFSAADRTALYAAYSATINLPADPVSWTTVSGAMLDNRARIMGSGVYGPGGGVNTQYTIYMLATGTDGIRTVVNTINTNAARIPTSPASTTDVTNARDYLAGPGYVQASDSLHVLSTAFTSGNFTVTDRTTINSIYTQVSGVTHANLSAQLTATYNQITQSYNTLLVVKGKTDNLPTDPVSTVHMDLQFQEISGALGASGSFSNTDRDNINAILTNTNRIPIRPADADVTFGANDRTYLNAVYGKTINLPPDPASNTMISLASSSLTTQISGVMSRLGSPANASFAADIAATKASADTASTNASNAYSTSLSVYTRLGSPISGSIAADLSSTLSASLNVSASLGNAVVDLSPVLSRLGQPVTTLARDVYELARLVRTKK